MIRPVIGRIFFANDFHKNNGFESSLQCNSPGFNIDHLVLQLGQNQNKDEVKAKIEKCADKNENKDSAAVWAYRGMKCFIGENLPLVQTSLKKPT